MPPRYPWLAPERSEKGRAGAQRLRGAAWPTPHTAERSRDRSLRDAALNSAPRRREASPAASASLLPPRKAVKNLNFHNVYILKFIS